MKIVDDGHILYVQYYLYTQRTRTCTDFGRGVDKNVPLSRKHMNALKINVHDLAK